MIYLLNNDGVRIPNVPMRFSDEWRINVGDFIKWGGNSFRVVYKEFSENDSSSFGKVTLYVRKNILEIPTDKIAFEKAIADNIKWQ